VKKIVLCLQACLICYSWAHSLYSPRDVVINEIAWRTPASAGYIWIELYNNTDRDINLEGWKIRGKDRNPGEIIIEGYPEDDSVNLNNSTITAGGYFLIERISSAGDNPSIGDMQGDFQHRSFWNWLRMGGERISIHDMEGTEIDYVDCSEGWFAGCNELSMSMERINPEGESCDPLNWGTYNPALQEPYAHDAEGNPIYGTPGRKNSLYDSRHGIYEEPEKILEVDGSPFFPYSGKSTEAGRIIFKNLSGRASRFSLKIYNINGSRVRHLLRRKELYADEWDYIIWDGRDDYGEILPVGIYIVFLEAVSLCNTERKSETSLAVLGRRF